MKDFFKQLGATFLGLTIFTFFAVFIVSNSLVKKVKRAIFVPEVKEELLTEHNVLHIKLKGPLREYRRSPFSSSTSFAELAYGLTRASQDPSIKAVFIEIQSGFSTGHAYLEAIAEILEEFKKSKKPIVVLSDNYPLPLLSAFSSADILSINPAGSVSLQGRSASLVHYKRLLDKLSVTPIVYQSGKNKNAGERFTHATPSQGTKDHMSSLLFGLYNFNKNKLSRNRGLNKDLIDALNEQYAFLTPLQGKQSRIIDSVQDKEDLLKELEWIVANRECSEGSYEKIDKEKHFFSPARLDVIELSAYNSIQSSRNQSETPSEDEVVIIPLEGSIVNERSEPGKIGGDDTVDMLRKYAESPTCKAVVLIINSPGGDAIASEKIRRAIERLTKKIPVIAFIRSYCASGGYYIIMNTNYIIAQETSIIGSIGVISMSFSLEGLLDKLGVDVTTIKTTPYADLGNIYHVPSEREKAAMQESIAYMNNLFRLQVTKARHLNPKDIEEIADGRVFLADMAKKHKLIDKKGYLYHAISIAVAMARLQPGKFCVTYHRDPIDIRDFLLSIAGLRSSGA